MAAALAASGGAVSASGLYTVTALFSNFLIRVCNTVFLPMLYAFLALAMWTPPSGRTGSRDSNPCWAGGSAQG